VGTHARRPHPWPPTPAQRTSKHTCRSVRIGQTVATFSAGVRCCRRPAVPQHTRCDRHDDRFAAKDADRELAVIECCCYPAAEAGGRVQFSLVTAVLPLIDKKVAWRGAAYVRPEAQGGRVPWVQLDLTSSALTAGNGATTTRAPVASYTFPGTRWGYISASVAAVASATSSRERVSVSTLVRR
jgi:hypothetical protein